MQTYEETLKRFHHGEEGEALAELDRPNPPIVVPTPAPV